MTARDFLHKLSRRLDGACKLYVRRDRFTVAVNKWQKCRGDQTLRLDYPLGPASVVFDVGGYKGEWSAGIVARYDPRVFIFEPVHENAAAIEQMFCNNPKVQVLVFGFSDRDGEAWISLSDNASSTMLSGERRAEIQLRDVAAVVRELNVDQIDLIKINIEGGEYDVLPRMLDCGLVENCLNLQIQFHNFVPNAELRREEIRSRLSKTHELTYDFYFVWENWRRRSGIAPSRHTSLDAHTPYVSETR